MGKRKASTSRQGEEEENPRREVQSKQKHEPGSISQGSVTSPFASLFKNTEKSRAFRERFYDRHILEYKYVNFTELTKMYEEQHIDTATYIAGHGWTNFVQINRPIYVNLVRILFSNLDETSMVSWIGKTKVDLSMKAWCRVFHLPQITDEAEETVMNMSREDIFFKLTGKRNLGGRTFIRVNQLHQEANIRLSAQIVMNILVPKQGSKEQIKIEEGRLLYAMVSGRKINLAKLIVERLRAIMGRKSIPICYGMHITEMMAQAGIDLTCAADSDSTISSEIDLHTFQHEEWNYADQGRMNTSSLTAGQSELSGGTKNNDHTEAPAPAEPAAPSHIPNITPQSEEAHLRQYIMEQFHSLQATLLSKLDSIETRVQACEAHLLQPPRSSSISPPVSYDPKGKASMISPSTFPAPTFPTTSPHPSQPPPSPRHTRYTRRTRAVSKPGISTPPTQPQP